MKVSRFMRVGFIIAIIAVVLGFKLSSLKDTVAVEIKNQGCKPIIIPSNIPVIIPGLQVQEGPIYNGSYSTIRVPGVSIELIATQNLISVIIGGQTGNRALPSNTTEVTFDGQSIVNSTAIFDLAHSPKHELIIQCKYSQ